MGTYDEWDVIRLYWYAIYHHLRFFLHRPFDGGMIVRARHNYLFVNTIYSFSFCWRARFEDEQAGSGRGMTGACPAKQINKKTHLKPMPCPNSDCDREISHSALGHFVPIDDLQTPCSVLHRASMIMKYLCNHPSPVLIVQDPRTPYACHHAFISQVSKYLLAHPFPCASGTWNAWPCPKQPSMYVVIVNKACHVRLVPCLSPSPRQQSKSRSDDCRHSWNFAAVRLDCPDSVVSTVIPRCRDSCALWIQANASVARVRNWGGEFISLDVESRSYGRRSGCRSIVGVI